MIRALVASLVRRSRLVAGAAAQERTVNVYNWSDYIDPKVLEDFTKETGIKVVYDTYDNNEIVETKLLAGKSGYDIVVPSGPFLQRLIKAEGVPEARQGEAAEPEAHVAGDDAAPRGLRSRQPVRRQLHVGHDGHRHQRREGARSGSASMPLNTWDIVHEAGARREAEGLRHPHARLARGRVPRHPATISASTRIRSRRTTSQGRRRAVQHPRQHPEVPLLRIHQRARQRRHLHGGRLFGRRAAGEEARRGGEERRRDRLHDPARRRADVVRFASRSRPTPRTSRRRTTSSTT